MVEDIWPDAKRIGLVRDRVQVDVELKLREAGIKVLTEDEWDNTPGHPWLYININTRKHPDVPIYAYSIKVELKQNARLPREVSTSILAVTWSISSIGLVGENKLKDTGKIVGERVDLFINDFLAENPVKRKG